MNFTTLGRCPMCLIEEPITYDLQPFGDGSYRFKLVGRYPIHPPCVKRLEAKYPTIRPLTF